MGFEREGIGFFDVKYVFKQVKLAAKSSFSPTKRGECLPLFVFQIGKFFPVSRLLS